MALIMDPEPGMSVYDPCCGSAGLLIACEHVLDEKMKHSGTKYAPLKMHGQEYVATTWAMANMNMIIHDMEGTIEIGDTFKNPKFRPGNRLQTFSCTDENFEELRLKDGDIVFARIGATTGKSFRITNPPDAVFASYLIRVRVKPGLRSDYLSFFFRTPAYWRQIKSAQGHNLKGGFNSSLLRRLLIPVPGTEEEQEQIANILATLDSKISIARRKAAALGELSSELLDLLMTGEVRVSDLEAAQEKKASSGTA